MKKKQKILLMIMSLFVSVFALGGTVTTYAASKTTTVALNTNASYLVKGETTTLKVKGTSKKTTWKTSNKRVATVSSKGKVKAVGYGSTYISATVDKKTYKCKVTVVNPAKITLEPSKPFIIVDGDSVSLNPKGYSAATIKKLGITYKTSKNSGANVSKSGEVTATKAGKFDVTAYVHGKKGKTIEMKAVVYPGFKEPELKMHASEGNQVFAPFADDFFALYDDVNVSSSNEDVVKVEKNLKLLLDDSEYGSEYDYCGGLFVENLREGTATISVTIQGVTKDLTVIVGDGKEKLAPVDAVKNNDFTGYEGNPLTTLQWVRNFIDTNNLMSDTLSDREKITIIQNYFNQTFNQNPNGGTYTKTISRILFDGVFNSDNDCSSYAETMCFLLECIDIEVYFSEGSADVGNNEWRGHAWNKVKADGTWYYIDAYWNAYRNNFDYFMSETLWDNHRLEDEGYYAELGYNGYVTYSNDLD
jgi:archaellum component FlaF (FlaF/FlaG flagellin family)